MTALYAILETWAKQAAAALVKDLGNTQLRNRREVQRILVFLPMKMSLMDYLSCCHVSKGGAGPSRDYQFDIHLPRHELADGADHPAEHASETKATTKATTVKAKVELSLSIIIQRRVVIFRRKL